MGAMNVVGKDTTDEAANEVVSGDDNNNSSFLLPPQSSLAFLESLTMPLVQEVVISADIGCIECQKRISNVLSRFNAEMESVVVNLSEKKVIVTCKYLKVSATQIITSRRSVFSKVASIKRMFGPSKKR